MDNATLSTLYSSNYINSTRLKSNNQINNVGTWLKIILISYFTTIQFHLLVNSDIFDLITPRSVPGDVRPFSSDLDIDLDLSWNISQRATIKPWLFYIDQNLNNAIETCLSKIKKKRDFIKMWTCLMNCSPSCRRMKHQLKRQCVSVKLGWANSFAVNYPPPKKTAIVGRHILTPDACPVIYPDPIVVVYQKLLMSIWYSFDVDPSLRINFTFLHFDLTGRHDCFREKVSDFCNTEPLVFIHIMNRPSTDRTHFKVSI